MKASTDHEPAGHADAYTEAGVDSARQERALRGLLSHIGQTRTGRQLLPIGLFANVLDLGNGLGLAVSMDGVGTKAIIAQLMDRYDTIGIDCVAMNVNDLLCVGATPTAMLDYIAVSVPDERLLEQIGVGLAEGARQAEIDIPGGEVAQIGDMLRGGDEAFDLVGCAVGTVGTDRIVSGRDLREGDVVVGLRSSGIHSNGLSLARRALLEGEFAIDSTLAVLGRTVGEELLAPTIIYVKPVLEMLSAGLKVKSLAHITSDGLLNLRRIESDFGFVIDHLPEPQPIFGLIEQAGDISQEEMFRVYNMGIGFCAVVDPRDAGRAIDIAAAHGIGAYRIGHAVPDPKRRVHLQTAGLVSDDSGSAFRPAGT